MKKVLDILITVLIVGWLFGDIGFGAIVGIFIHFLLVVAVVLIVMKLISKA